VGNTPTWKLRVPVVTDLHQRRGSFPRSTRPSSPSLYSPLPQLSPCPQERPYDLPPLARTAPAILASPPCLQKPHPLARARDLVIAVGGTLRHAEALRTPAETSTCSGGRWWATGASRGGGLISTHSTRIMVVGPGISARRMTMARCCNAACRSPRPMTALLAPVSIGHGAHSTCALRQRPHRRGKLRRHARRAVQSARPGATYPFAAHPRWRLPARELTSQDAALRRSHAKAYELPATARARSHNRPLVTAFDAYLAITGRAWKSRGER